MERKIGQKTTTKYSCPYCGRKLFIFIDEIQTYSEVVVCKSCGHQYTISYLKMVKQDGDKWLAQYTQEVQADTTCKAR